MADKKVIILGASGHAKVISDIFEQQGEYTILGFLDRAHYAGTPFFGYEILGRDHDIPALLKKHSNCYFFVAIGDNWERKLVQEKIIALYPKANFVNAIHPSAQIGRNVSIGNGVAIMGGAVINSGTIIEDFSIVNTRVSIDHDNHLQKFSSIGPGATLGGNVTVGAHSIVGMAATIKHGCQIGQHSLVGAGALVLQSFADNDVLYGSPARFIRKREAGDLYL